ncbi:MAG: DUF2141 domain-containing protein, partial [Pseudomonadota bacterium]
HLNQLIEASMFGRALRVMSVLGGTAALLLSGPAVEAADKGNLTIAIKKIKNSNGRILVCLFSKPSKFPECTGNAPGVKTLAAKAKKGSVLISVKHVPVGTYAISAAHDQNDDGKIDKHLLFGYPTEGAGMSNYPKPLFGPPKYDTAKFQLTKGTKKVDVVMHYP